MKWALFITGAVSVFVTTTIFGTFNGASLIGAILMAWGFFKIARDDIAGGL